MHYVMIKSKSDTESGYYFFHDKDGVIQTELMILSLNMIDAEWGIDNVEDFLQRVRIEHEEESWWKKFERLSEEDLDAIEDYVFCIGGYDLRTVCYTEDPKEFIEYLKTIDEDLIEGMDADEAGKAIAEEYTTW